LARRVAEQRKGNAAELRRPGAMRLDVVHADAQHLRLEGLELREAFAESDHLRRADEGEVGRIEEEEDPLPAELRQRDAARPAGVRSLQGEGWRRRVQG